LEVLSSRDCNKILSSGKNCIPSVTDTFLQLMSNRFFLQFTSKGVILFNDDTFDLLEIKMIDVSSKFDITILRNTHLKLSSNNGVTLKVPLGVLINVSGHLVGEEYSYLFILNINLN